jgi:hypothetical protein
MRDLINFLFSNLIPIIIVTSVVIRILKALRNSPASRRGRVPPVPEPGDREDEGESDVWSRLKPDEDEEEERGASPPGPVVYGPGPGGNYGPRGAAGASGGSPGYFTRPLLMPAPSPGEAPPPPSPPDPDPIIARPFAPVNGAAEPDAGPARPGRHPLDRLNRLSPLRRAVILAEILGPPRSLSGSDPVRP